MMLSISTSSTRAGSEAGQNKAAIAATAAQAWKIRKTVHSLSGNQPGWAGDVFLDALNKTFVGENVTSAAYTQEVRFMAKKQAIVKETAVSAPPARAAKPKTPRVRTAKHSKAVSTESAAAQTNPENSREAIAKIAYSYWEARGCRPGDALEDWVRAEHEYRQRSAAARP
jgi:hypothetical protein